jgi:nucleoside triphosphate pyrophosphatase
MLQRPLPRLILASGSASRRALLESAGLTFSVVPAEVDEAAVKLEARRAGLGAEAAALRLADLKAVWVADRNPDALVIGADQLLVCDGIWFDKPADSRRAGDQRCALRGRAHDLVTAVVCRRGGDALWRHVAIPRLSIRMFSDTFLAAYLEAEGDAVTTSVGAYRLEALGVHLFDQIEGEHSAILGLPMLALLKFLRDRGILTR